MRIEIITDEQLEQEIENMLGDVEILGRSFSIKQILKEIDPIWHRDIEISEMEHLKDDGYYTEEEAEDDGLYECSECGNIFTEQEEADECCENGNGIRFKKE